MLGLMRDGDVLQRCLQTASAGAAAAQQLRALCIGVGGGSLPLFLAHHFPGLRVDAVELDPAVLAAASQAMGFQPRSCHIRAQELDKRKRCSCLLCGRSRFYYRVLSEF